MDIEGTITLHGSEKLTHNVRKFQELQSVGYASYHGFKRLRGINWQIMPCVHLAPDGLSKFASFEIIPVQYCDVFKPLEYTTDVENSVLVGIFEVSYYADGSDERLEWRKNKVTEPVPSQKCTMPLRVRVEKLPIKVSGRLEFDFQWGIMKTHSTLETNVPVRQTRFNLPSYLMNPKFSDVVFNVRGVKLQAHKLILAAKSPVLDAAFSHEMKEKQTGCVVIDDVTPEVFRELLRFFYTDELPVEVLKKHGASLLLAAEKYDLPKLIDLCMPHAVNSQTSFEDILRLYMLASSQGSTSNSNLKTNIIEFIKSKGRICTRSASFLKFVKENPGIASEILAELI